MTIRSTTEALSGVLSELLAKRGMPPVGARANDLCVIGFRNADDSDRFNDVVGFARRRVAGGPIHLALNRGTVDPGRAALRDPMNPRGVFRMASGRQARIWTPGYHRQKDYGTTRPALVQVAKSKILGFRDYDRDDVFEKLLAVDDPSGVNFHGGMQDHVRDQPVGHYSHGCWVSSQAFVNEVLSAVEEQRLAGMGRIVSAHLWDLTEDPECAMFFAALGLAA